MSKRNPTYKDMLRIARQRIKAKDYMGAHEAITASGANMIDIQEFFTKAEMKAMARWANQRVGATPKRKKNPLGWEPMSRKAAREAAVTHAFLAKQPAAVGMKGSQYKREYTVMPGIMPGTKTAFGWKVIEVITPEKARKEMKKNPKSRRNPSYFKRIYPKIEEETWEEQRAAGRYNPAMVFIYGNNRYTLSSGTSDDLSFWKSGKDIWVLSRNNRMGYAHLAVYEVERKKQSGPITYDWDIYINDLSGDLGDMAPGDPYDWSDAKMRDVLSEWM